MPDARPPGVGIQAPVSVRLLGRFALRRGQIQVADRDVGSRKARILLKLLGVEHPAFVSTERIVEAVWAGDGPGRPTEAVATLVNRLRGVLGADAIVGGRGAYALVRDLVEVDLNEVAHLVVEAEARLGAGPGLAYATASRAMEVVGDGRVLEEEPDAPWADPARRHASALLRTVSSASRPRGQLAESHQQAAGRGRAFLRGSAWPASGSAGAVCAQRCYGLVGWVGYSS